MELAAGQHQAELISPPGGPRDPTRSAPAQRLLSAARLAAEEAGVTRLADLTRLDRIGFPVWQAVRPMSRALSVHQGKGATDADAQLGALLEAVESHHAEMFDREGPCCPFAALPPDRRARDFADFALDRADPPDPDADHRWVEAVDLLSGAPLYLPFDIVSLDFTRGVPSRFDRASNGIAAGASRDEAVAVALHEIIERDAVVEWQSRSLAARTADAVRLSTIPFGWFAEWRRRIEAAGASVRCYRVPTVTGAPAFVCELNDLGKQGAPYRCAHGQACHPDPEIALFKALAEAIQSRATFVAGAREDLRPSDYAAPVAGTVTVAFGLPTPPNLPGVAWSSVAPGPRGAGRIAATLAAAGYPRIAVVELAAPAGFHIVRAFVCGLGSMDRRRRAPPR